MHIVFTEEEKIYINMNFLNWEIKKDCPKHLKKSIIEKIELIKRSDKNNYL